MQTSNMLFNGWYPVLHTLVVGSCGYFGFIALVRIAGNRTLSHLTAFDFIVSVTYGSILGRSMLAGGNSLVQTFVALALLVVLQYVVSSLSRTSTPFHNLVTPQARLVYCDGRFLEAEMRAMRLREDECMAAVRAEGLQSIDAVYAIVVESHGSLTCIPRKDDAANAGSSLAGVLGASPG